MGCLCPAHPGWPLCCPRAAGAAGGARCGARPFSTWTPRVGRGCCAPSWRPRRRAASRAATISRACCPQRCGRAAPLDLAWCGCLGHTCSAVEGAQQCLSFLYSPLRCVPLAGYPLSPPQAATLARGRKVRQAKLLFYAKLAEKGLQTYERDGWGEFPTQASWLACFPACVKAGQLHGLPDYGPACKPCMACMGLRPSQLHGGGGGSTIPQSPRCMQIIPERREIRPTADRGPILLCVDTSGESD